MPSPHSLYGLRVILIVSAYFYMNMNCFGLVRVVSRWLRVGLVAVDSFEWVVADGFGWLRMVSGGFGWFGVVCCFSSYVQRLHLAVSELRSLIVQTFSKAYFSILLL